jgi:ABC-2 type transport system permease protein
VSPRRAIGLTARREIRERGRSRAFLVSTAIQVVIVVAIVVISSLVGSGKDSFKVGTYGDGDSLGQIVKAHEDSIDADVTLVPYPNEQAASDSVDSGDADIAAGDRKLITGGDPSEALVALVQAAARSQESLKRLSSHGLSEKEARKALDPPGLTVSEVSDGDSSGGLAFVSSLLLYIALLTFGIALATGVVEEKSTRVVEVVLSAIRPVQLLTGKILGIGLLGIVQLAVVVGAGLAVAIPTGAVDLPSGTAGSVALVAVYFVLGYLLYACGFAIAGASVSRQEDVQSAAAPLSILLVAGYLIGISTSGSGDSGLAQICTFIPLFAPMIVPGRAIQGDLPGWELALSLALMVLAIALLLWLAARIYDRAILRMGAPIKLREVLKLAR